MPIVSRTRSLTLTGVALLFLVITATVSAGQLDQVATLPGVSDVAPIGRGNMFDVTSRAFGGEGKLYRVSRGSTRELADLFAFESRVNPDGGIIDTNPFDVEVLNGGAALVADAAANALLIVNQQGDVDWIATLPDEVVPTAHAQVLYGCPQQGPAIVCNNATHPAQGVATSVAIGPDVPTTAQTPRAGLPQGV